MKPPGIPVNEQQRQMALHSYRVLDTSPEKEFDDLTWLSSKVADTPIALVSLVDATRQWFKSIQGLDVCETSREISFCGHVVLAGEPLEVTNALEDYRFADNPLVSGPPDIRFYYGVPIINAQGFVLGTLCVIDRVPRSLTAEQRSMLAVIARQVMSQLELRLSALQSRQAYEQAEQASQSKSYFLANMSHEIRTPMNSIVALTELALTTELNEEQRGYLETVNNAADTLLGLLNDILDLSKIEAGRLEFERVSFDLAESIRTLLKLQALQAREKGLSLHLELDPNLPRCVLGDPVRLNQALLNLLSNAIKFTEQGSITMAVTLQREEDSQYVLRFQVSDTGIGIPLERQRDIFDAFSQVDASTTRLYGGTGLGLAISSRLVAMMGGVIHIDSSPGRGSRFSFDALLPKAIDAPEAKEAANGPIDDDSSTQLGTHILVVDDVAANRLVAGKVLQKMGYCVTLACGGIEALALLQRGRFELILMDIQMPDMDGIETTAAIRRLGSLNGGDTPIVALTGHDMKGDRERFLGAGMNDCLVKPIRKRALKDVISRTLAKASKRQDRL